MDNNEKEITEEELTKETSEMVPEEDSSEKEPENAKEDGEDAEQRAETRGVFIRGILTGAMLVACIVIIGLLVRCATSSEGSETLAKEGETKSADLLTAANLNKIKQVKDLIDANYLNEVDYDDMADGMIAGMVDSLGDPYSIYYTAEELNKVVDSSNGYYFGIGAYIGLDKDTGYAYIAGVIKGTPAEESGVMTGDLIYAVDGEETYGYDTSQVTAMIRGPENTTVDITFYRMNKDKTGYDPIDITLTRRRIDDNTVSYEMLDNGIAHIWIYEFDKVTKEQFDAAMESARADGMKGLIIDLRDNPGGNLVTAVDILRTILPKGVVTYTENKNGKMQVYDNPEDHTLDVPMVLLVNGNSASASEVFSGAVRDYGVGTLIGTNTYGKGIVQRVIGLSDGSAVKLTISNYFTPNGENIHGKGIAPDIEIELDYDAYLEDRTDNQLNCALDYLKEKLQ